MRSVVGVLAAGVLVTGAFLAGPVEASTRESIACECAEGDPAVVSLTSRVRASASPSTGSPTEALPSQVRGTRQGPPPELGATPAASGNRGAGKRYGGRKGYGPGGAPSGSASPGAGPAGYGAPSGSPGGPGGGRAVGDVVPGPGGVVPGWGAARGLPVTGTRSGVVAATGLAVLAAGMIIAYGARVPARQRRRREEGNTASIR